MDEIIYTTTKEQINKLKQQNLIIQDENKAQNMLSLYGYSNLIKSYREPYIHISNGKKMYRSGITFEQICSLYLLDKQLRNAVMASMQDLEEHIKEAAADVVASAFGTHPDDYLRFRNYSNKRKRQERFALSGILQTMHKTLDTDKNPIHHYQTEHGVVPPWILFKSIYFTTINNFIDQFKTEQKDEMVNKLYDIGVLGVTQDAARLLMMDTLFICQNYRNTAAHGGRTYNYQSETNLRTSEIFVSELPVDVHGFSELMFLLSLFKYESPYRRLEHVLRQELTRHCSRFPQDITYLGQILNMDIVPKNIVYVSEKSNKYHANPHCSGTKNANEIVLEDAQALGFKPCKRCANDITPYI